MAQIFVKPVFCRVKLALQFNHAKPAILTFRITTYPIVMQNARQLRR